MQQARQRLRRALLAVSVLYDIDLNPRDGGITLSGAPSVEVSWSQCVQALAGAEPDGGQGRDRLAGWLRARRWVADRSLSDLAERTRPVGLPVGHALHPGPAWVRHRVLGGALDLGLGQVGLDPARPGSVEVVPPGVWVAADIDPTPWWKPARDYLAAMCTLAVARRRRSSQAPLRPMGDCDVVTLLGCGAFRAALIGAGGGMVAVAVPMRERGWTDLRRIDPAFVVAAAAATDARQRGFERPLLVTAEEVALVAGQGRPARDVLLDAAPQRPWLRPVRYR